MPLRLEHLGDVSFDALACNATLVDTIVAEVGTSEGCQLFEDRVRVLKSCSAQEAATRNAGPPINKAKAPKARHHPHFNPKG